MKTPADPDILLVVAPRRELLARAESVWLTAESRRLHGLNGSRKNLVFEN